MSDLVGNPEDRFSRVAAHIEIFKVVKNKNFQQNIFDIFFLVLLKT